VKKELKVKFNWNIKPIFRIISKTEYETQKPKDVAQYLNSDITTPITDTLEEDLRISEDEEMVSDPEEIQVANRYSPITSPVSPYSPRHSPEKENTIDLLGDIDGDIQRLLPKALIPTARYPSDFRLSAGSNILLNEVFMEKTDDMDLSSIDWDLYDYNFTQNVDINVISVTKLIYLQ
jgi:hypothetical protein